MAKRLVQFAITLVTSFIVVLVFVVTFLTWCILKSAETEIMQRTGVTQISVPVGIDGLEFDRKPVSERHSENATVSNFRSGELTGAWNKASWTLILVPGERVIVYESLGCLFVRRVVTDVEQLVKSTLLTC